MFEQKYFLGVDLGVTSIKAVELKMDKDRIELVNFGIAEIEGEFGEEDVVSYEKKRVQYLAALLRRMGLHTKEMNVSVPGLSGLVSVLELPKMGQRELSEAIQFEARKCIPVDLDKVAISWDLLKQKKEEIPSKRESMLNILLVAAFKKDIQKISEIVTNVEFSVGTMELEVFSLARSLAGSLPGTHIIVDIGHHSSNVVLVKEGEVWVSRGVDLGGGDITKTIMEGMNIAHDRAESLKKERDFFHQNEVSLSFFSVETILNEVRRIQVAFEKRSSENKIDSVLLSGGSALLPGMEKYCSDRLGIPVEVGDPWRDVFCDKAQLTPQIKRETSPFFSVAIGLALHSFEKRK